MFPSNNIGFARKFRELNIEPSAREIEAVPPVEALASYGDDKVLPPPTVNQNDAAASVGG